MHRNGKLFYKKARRTRRLNRAKPQRGGFHI